MTRSLTSLAVVCHTQHKSQQTLSVSSLLQQDLRVTWQPQKEAECDEGMRRDGREGSGAGLTSGLGCLCWWNQHWLIDVLQ